MRRSTRTEFVLVTPRGMAIRWTGAASAAAAGRGEDHPGQDVTLRTWAGGQKPQLVVEPQQAPFAEYVASVRPGSGVAFAAWRDYLRDQRLGRCGPTMRCAPWPSV